MTLQIEHSPFQAQPSRCWTRSQQLHQVGASSGYNLALVALGNQRLGLSAMEFAENGFSVDACQVDEICYVV